MRIPILTELSTDEKRIAELQIGFATRLRKSAYFVVEKSKSNGEFIQDSTLCARLTETSQSCRVILTNIGRRYPRSQH
jgi:hypothetical protein